MQNNYIKELYYLKKKKSLF